SFPPLSLLASPFHAPATPSLSPLSLHDALPICIPLPRPRAGLRGSPRHPARLRLLRATRGQPRGRHRLRRGPAHRAPSARAAREDRKSTRLNSSHVKISYAVFCLKKKTKALARH